jgi:hypothetical protein
MAEELKKYWEVQFAHNKFKSLLAHIRVGIILFVRIQSQLYIHGINL